MKELDQHRLPRTAAPIRYDVTLEPNLAESTFEGSIKIAITVTAPTDVLVLNAAELDVTACLVDEVPATHELDADAERLVVRVDGDLTPGEHLLAISFTGTLNDRLRGWYRSTYLDDDGREQVIAASQMQATDCRRAFPCWDEPDFKAVFGITLIVESHLLAVSNGSELERVELDGDRTGKFAVRFADTMKMSTYLVAVIVGPLEATDWIDVDGVPMRIVHVPGKGHLTDFGIDVASFCLRWFQDYYGIAYPSDKVDLLALPDFAAGAMENLGCITFRESLLLVDPTSSTQVERQLVADVVAHELAHMWFGDLVTMRWWNGIWLNEAFATFMELAACDAYRPDWHRWTSFGLERSMAFEVDSLTSTRSVEFEVRSPQEAEGMFDVLTYQKGGALLRMLEKYLGADRFHAGVSHYLRRHAYGNTETSDLWDAIEHTSGEPVRRIMDSWIWQPGFPVVSASTDGSQLLLRQRQFSFDPDAPATSLWAIPIAVRQGEATTTVLLDTHEIRLPLTSEPVVVNAGGHGFFRVSYDEELRHRLAGPALATLDTLERYNLVDDAWNAVVAGDLDAIEYVEFVEGFGAERDLAVWQAIVIGLRSTSRLLTDDAVAHLRPRIRSLAEPVLVELGEPAPGESDLRAKLRGLLLATVSVLGGDTDMANRARELHVQSVADPTSVDPELASAATMVVAATGDRVDYDAMLNVFLTSPNPQEQLRNLYALAEYDDADLMDRTCRLAFSDDVKTQNAPFLLRQCIANRHHGANAWRFIRQHWDEANERFPSNTISRMIESVKLLNTPVDVADVQGFFAEHPIPQAGKTLEQVLERQRVNAAVRERNEIALATALRS